MIEHDGVAKENLARRLCELSGVAWCEAQDSSTLAAQLADAIAKQLQSRIDVSGAASLVVSGGSTPAPVFKRLSEKDIDWHCVNVTLADERWVDLKHQDSNEALVRSMLLVDKAAEAGFVSLYRPGMSPELALGTVAKDVLAMRQPFTVVILGMGGDGHTASLFPDAPVSELQAAMDIDSAATAAVLHPPSVEQTRITLSRAALLHAEHRVLHITGESKRQVLVDALLKSSAMAEDPNLDVLVATGQWVAGDYSHGMKPVIGLITRKPQAMSVYWSQ